MTKDELISAIANSNVPTKVFTRVKNMLMESNTCKDCASYTNNQYPDQAYCDEGVLMDDDINMLEPDFGCNMFKAKEK